LAAKNSQKRPAFGNPNRAISLAGSIPFFEQVKVDLRGEHHHGDNVPLAFVREAQKVKADGYLDVGLLS
ncbi:MAG: hypothetical protein KDD60_06065, partial [Bdellovibrionales bacterium]|nr:hypothetical protein [Bdellovibrionales bacterium]